MAHLDPGRAPAPASDRGGAKSSHQGTDDGNSVAAGPVDLLHPDGAELRRLVKAHAREIARLRYQHARDVERIEQLEADLRVEHETAVRDAVTTQVVTVVDRYPPPVGVVTRVRWRRRGTRDWKGSRTYQRASAAFDKAARLRAAGLVVQVAQAPRGEWEVVR